MPRKKNSDDNEEVDFTLDVAILIMLLLILVTTLLYYIYTIDLVVALISIVVLAPVMFFLFKLATKYEVIVRPKGHKEDNQENT